MKELAAWLNKYANEEGTNGDFLRAFLTSLAKAVIALLDVLGEWPIDVQ